jgi:hypothetical protein
MKTTIYTLTISDDGQMNTGFFDTKKAMNAEIKRIIQEHCGDEFDEILKQADGDVHEAYSIAQNDHAFEIDMYWTSHDVEVPTKTRTIYTLATDTDENGFHLSTFATEQARDNAAWNFVLELWDAGEFDGKRPDPESDDLFETWEYVRSDNVDSMWLEDSEIDLPDAPVNAKLLAAFKALRGDRPDNDAKGRCRFCGRDNSGHEHERCIYDCPGEVSRAAIAQAEADLSRAETGAPLRVVIEVSGGVAEVTVCPPGVDVEIVDHDNTIEAVLERQREDHDASLAGKGGAE